MIHAKFGENGMAVELEQDMVTMKETLHVCIPGDRHIQGTGFERHGYFEAPSIRRINNRYYLVYCSYKSHVLWYVVSEKPTEGYVYGGTIVSNGDIGYQERIRPVNTLGNNHGGIVQIGEDYYIFYHRQTHGTEFSRHGCAKKIRILPDGSIPQTEITSYGLNGGALPASGSYPAAIACHVTCPETMDHIDYQNPAMLWQTSIVQKQNVQFLTDIQDRTVLGYKYFVCKNVLEIALELRGTFTGTVRVATDEEGRRVMGERELSVAANDWNIISVSCSVTDGVHALYLLFSGEGTLDMKMLSFRKS